jgi:hypothetical protein
MNEWAKLLVQMGVPLLVGWLLARKIQKLDVRVDGRLTDLLKSSGAAQRAEGHAEGVEAERVRK